MRSSAPSRRAALTVALLGTIGCATTPPPSGGAATSAPAARTPTPSAAPAVSATVSRETKATAAAERGLMLPPGAGEHLTYCARPLSLTILVDSVTAPATRLVAGLGELRGDEGSATHAGADEVVYVVRGSGHAVLGTDTVALRPGTVAFVPEGVSHQLVSTGAEPLTYLWVIGPRASARAFRRAATLGCPPPSAALQNRPAPAPPSPSSPPSAAPAARRAAAFEPDAGDRITYCLFPLTITTKVDAQSAPGGRLTAAVGALRRGTEVGTHRLSDEVVYVTRGRGRAFIGADTTTVEAGSVTFTPAGTVHGFMNDSDEPLEYIIVYSSSFSPANFRALATKPGPYCTPAAP